MLCEYYNLDIKNNYKLKSPELIKHKDGDVNYLECNYNNDNIIEILSPPLKCTKIIGKKDYTTNRYVKYIVECEISDNDWRFVQFFKDLKQKSQQILKSNGKKWFGCVFSDSIVKESYKNILTRNSKKILNENHKILKTRLSKEFTNSINKSTLKKFKDHYIILQLSYSGILLNNGIFSEIWKIVNIIKSEPVIYDRDSDSYIDNNTYNDIEFGLADSDNDHEHQNKQTNQNNLQHDNSEQLKEKNNPGNNDADNNDSNNNDSEKNNNEQNDPKQKKQEKNKKKNSYKSEK